ncbi:MAG: low-specificity L-threonine aldolase [Defluviitaleaceae bacterium]|nr:low-specificity L-threonine aldolase [Defluviitaleaceae bacterium]
MRYIDLRSDTVTLPTDEMRTAMAQAAVGDDVYGDDPTVIELEQIAAQICGKEAAMFTPSGTMANQLAIMTHTKRGDEIIVAKKAHIVAYEVGAPAVLSGVSYALVDNIDEIIRPQDIDELTRSNDVHFPSTGLLCLENALGSGKVVPLDDMKAAYNTAKRHNLPVHLDGARVFNAATYLGVDVKEITQYCDTIMFCISKGLAAPVGSLLLGSHEFIAKARRNRKMLGGGMRGAGILAAAGIISLNTMTKRLHIDHENAGYMTEELNKINGINVDMAKRDINLVFFTISKDGFNHNDFPKYMEQNGIKINGISKGSYRFATHNNISRSDIDKTLLIIHDTLIK